MVNYSVDLSGGITESFFTALAHLTGPHVRTRKRLTEITIELFQNICKHAINKDHRRLIIQKKHSAYRITAVNTVSAFDVPFIQRKISHINSLDPVQRKEQHSKILGRSTCSKKSGAGLGLYRIAIRSTSGLNASCERIDQNHFIFSLHVTLTA